MDKYNRKSEVKNNNKNELKNKIAFNINSNEIKIKT